MRSLPAAVFALPFLALADGDVPQQPIYDGKKPNIVFILTDDQDLHMDSLSYMPFVQKHLSDQGTSFQRHYCTVALCCPSRVSLWTGLAAHNTNVTDINPPYGGFPKFASQGFNEAYLPLWLQDAGYLTYYTGKLFNAQTVNNYHSPHAAGWTGSDFLLDPFTYEYMNATFQRNHDPPVSYEGKYTTDVLAEKTYGFLDDALEDVRPFFLTVAPTAPHSNVHIHEDLNKHGFSEKSATQSPPVPADRHKHLFNDVVVPRTPHFNPDEPNSVSWISRLPQQNQTNIDFNDNFYRNRLRALQSVDEMVDHIVTRLDEANVLDNTYIFYSTDNGYHIGQHRLQPGKQCAFEEDVNIPLIVRGPGVPAKQRTNIVTSHTDLAPTFLSLAGGQPNVDLDGSVIPLHAGAGKREWKQEHVNVEMWGIIMSEGNYGSVLYSNHTYKALRVVGKDYNLLYTVWCSGEHELYDLNHDPYEVHNIYPLDKNTQEEVLHFTPTHPLSTDSPQELDGGENEDKDDLAFDFPPNNKTNWDDSILGSTTLAHLIPRLDALLAVLKTCKGRTCTHPWSALHPNDDVSNLHEALDARFDDYYEEQLKDQRVHFLKCEKGYIAESEGPDGVEPFGYKMMVDEVAV